MSRSSKRDKPRRIVVGNQAYYWYVRTRDAYLNPDTCLHLYITSDIRARQRLHCTFDFHAEGNIPHNVLFSWSGLTITPSLVRRVIEYALDHGWQPLLHLPDLELGPMDEKIDLELERNRGTCGGVLSGGARLIWERPGAGGGE